MSNDLDMNSNDILNANGIDTQSLTIAGQTIVSSDDVTTTQAEVISLTDGQTVVVFTKETRNGTFYLNGPGADRGRLVQGTDYTVDHATKSITLTESYPAATQIVMVYFEGDSGIVHDPVVMLANKTAAVAYIDVFGVVEGTVYIITSSDGGTFIGKTGAAASTYDDNGGSYCGTQFTPTGGDGSSGLSRLEQSFVSPEMFGADGGGVIDDAAAFSLAGSCSVPNIKTTKGVSYRVATPVVFTSSVHLYGGGTIIPDLPNTGGKVFAFECDDVLVEDLIFDGSTSTGTLTGNMYIIFGGDGVTKFYRHSYKNLLIKDNTRSDGLSQTSNLLVTHALYIDNVDNVYIQEYRVDNLSGAAIFCRDVLELNIDGFNIKDSQWYNITLESGCLGFEIRNGVFDCQLTTGVYWGGAINLMSQVGEPRNENGVIERFTCKGYYSYGTPVRILSSTNITVRDFKIKNWQSGTWAASPDLSAVRVETRGISTASQNGPCHNIRVYNYDIEAPLNSADHRGIYIGNQWQTARVPATDIYIGKGRVLSTDVTNYFSEGIVFHGQDGGIENIHVETATVSTACKTGPIVGGGIGFIGNSSNGGCRDVWLNSNDLTDLGTPAASHQVGVSIGAYTDRVIQGVANKIDNYYYNLRTLPNSGPTLQDLDDQIFSNAGAADTLFNVSLSKFRKPLTGSTTWDPASIANGASETKQFTVTGAVLGDFVLPSFSLDVQDLGISATVAASNTVEVVLQNNSGGARDLASGTVYVTVFRRGTA
jgi:hypothetical protein